MMSHAEVPDYLRTKPDPEVELAEKLLVAEAGAQADQLTAAVCFIIQACLISDKHCPCVLSYGNRYTPVLLYFS